MTFDPQHFLDLATNLIGDTQYNGEARYRTSISRAYYAAHLVSKKKLEEIGITFPVEEDKAKIHKFVIDSLSRKNKGIGDMLWNLRRRRNEADYNLNTEFNKYGTELLLSAAETVIKEASGLKK
jgi:uncharacterized protein (UPF0332 family)